MAFIYANNNEVKALDERVSALPDPVPPTPAADYYRHKVTISGGNLNGHLYYTSTSNAALPSADTAGNWFNNVYSSGFAIPGCFYGSFNETSGSAFSILKIEYDEEGNLVKVTTAFEGDPPLLFSSFSSVITDEIIDL